jgi:hypothetical protein
LSAKRGDLDGVTSKPRDLESDRGYRVLVAMKEVYSEIPVANGRKK